MKFNLLPTFLFISFATSALAQWDAYYDDLDARDVDFYNDVEARELVDELMDLSQREQYIDWQELTAQEKKLINARRRRMRLAKERKTKLAKAKAQKAAAALLAKANAEQALKATTSTPGTAAAAKA
ncbi:hypothetical protein DFP72DRAFT_1044415 [Ephemerocybe angulata]|uniref:Uncharacterized protein n=1 Tax=Ephemerocybe angulata TaxID=980116 RepID=A0A8H6I359_9AGAR|nr:hypothetical protein DFP72DRAFT_1044415 [Tulosesus angulatus]